MLLFPFDKSINEVTERLTHLPVVMQWVGSRGQNKPWNLEQIALYSRSIISQYLHFHKVSSSWLLPAAGALVILILHKLGKSEAQIIQKCFWFSFLYRTFWDGIHVGQILVVFPSLFTHSVNIFSLSFYLIRWPNPRKQSCLLLIKEWIVQQSFIGKFQNLHLIFP